MRHTNKSQSGPIVLLASPGRTIGGYFVRTRRLLWHIYEMHPEQRFVLITPKGDPLASVELPPSVTPFESGFAKKSLVHRTLWIQFVLPYICFKLRATAIVGLGSYGPRWAPNDQSILVNNARLISPLFWKLPDIPIKTKLFVLLQRFFFGKALKGAARIGIQRRGLIDEIQRLWKIPRDRFVLVPNSPSIPDNSGNGGADFKLREKYPDRILFLFPSLYARHKNFEILTEAVERLEKTRLDGPEPLICLTLDENSQGHEKGAEKLVNKIRRSKARKYFCLLGEVSHDRMRALFNEVDVILYPSVIDSFSVIFLDAMECGRPIVAADLPHARDVCQDAAVYFTWNDAAGLAAAVEKLSSDAEFRDALVRKGLERVQEFSHAREMEGMMRLMGLDPDVVYSSPHISYSPTAIP